MNAALIALSTSERGKPIDSICEMAASLWLPIKSVEGSLNVGAAVCGSAGAAPADGALA